MTTPDRDDSRPLSGVRVLDLTRVLAGPYATMVLADLGAEVVKVERPGTGDDSRGFGPFLKSGLSAYFASLNRGKKSIELDLKQEADRQTFAGLVEKADVLVENFRPGTLAGLGFSHARLAELNPRLIVASTSGFGRLGRYGQRAAYDIIIQATSGLMSITGTPGGEPVRVGTSISDILAGLFTAIGILATLADRGRTGRGRDLDIAMLDCSVAVLENAMARFGVTGQAPGPLGTRHPSITPFQAFATGDGAIVVAAGNDSLWARLCELLETPEWIEDPRLATNAARTDHHGLVEELLTERFRTRTSEAWLEALEAAGIPAAPIRDVAEVAADEHLAERGMLHTMRDDGGQEFLTAGSPILLDGCPATLADRAPRLGEHNEHVRRDWLGQ